MLFALHWHTYPVSHCPQFWVPVTIDSSPIAGTTHSLLYLFREVSDCQIRTAQLCAISSVPMLCDGHDRVWAAHLCQHGLSHTALQMMLRRSDFSMPAVWVRSSGCCTMQGRPVGSLQSHWVSACREEQNQDRCGDMVAGGDTWAAEGPPVADAVSAQTHSCSHHA